MAAWSASAVALKRLLARTSDLPSRRIPTTRYRVSSPFTPFYNCKKRAIREPGPKAIPRLRRSRRVAGRLLTIVARAASTSVAFSVKKSPEMCRGMSHETRRCVEAEPRSQCVPRQSLRTRKREAVTHSGRSHGRFVIHRSGFAILSSVGFRHLSFAEYGRFSAPTLRVGRTLPVLLKLPEPASR